MNHFQLEEYKSLRDEIAQSRTNVFKLIIYGLASVPSFHLIARGLQLPEIWIILPLFVIVLALAYLSENLAIMRAGKYIRTEVEPFLEKPGWEIWLEKEHQINRRGDKISRAAFYVLFFVYYSMAVYVATVTTDKLFDSWLESGIPIIYGIMGILFAVFLIYFASTRST